MGAKCCLTVGLLAFVPSCSTYVATVIASISFSGERLRYVIVDEYQDVNPIQEAIVRSLHELGSN